MGRKSDVRKQNLRTRYEDKIRSIEETTKKHGDSLVMGNERDEVNNKSNNYSSLLNDLYNSDGDSWDPVAKAEIMADEYQYDYYSGGSMGNPSDCSTTAQEVWRFLTNIGYSPAATAGILGNMQQESGVDPSKVQYGKGHAAGIVQWESHLNKNGRWLKMKNHCASRGNNWETDLEGQLEYLDQEMRGGDPTTKSKMNSYFKTSGDGGYKAFKKLTDIDEATEVFMSCFERCSMKKNKDGNYTHNLSGRKKSARDFYNSLTSRSSASQYGLSNISNYNLMNDNLISDIYIDTESFARTGKIPIPTGSRSSYANSMVEYIKNSGGITNPMFQSYMVGDGKNKFINNTPAKSLNMNPTWLRKDLVQYLHILHSKASKELGVRKFSISSAYRSPEYNASIGGSKTSSHRAGCAVDICFGKNKNSYKDAITVANIASEMGFGGIAIGQMKKSQNHFLHLDINARHRMAYTGKNYDSSKVGKYESPSNTGA